MKKKPAKKKAKKKKAKKKRAKKARASRKKPRSPFESKLPIFDIEEYWAEREEAIQEAIRRRRKT